MEFFKKKNKKSDVDYRNHGVDPDESMKETWNDDIKAKPVKSDDVAEKLLEGIMAKLKAKGITPNSTIEEMEQYMRENNIPLPPTSPNRMKINLDRFKTKRELEAYISGQVDCMNALGRSIAKGAEITGDMDENVLSPRDVIAIISGCLDKVIEASKSEVKRYDEEKS